MEGRLLAFAAIILFLAVGVGAVQHSYWDSAVDSETHNTFEINTSIAETTTIALDGISNRSVVYAPKTDISVTQAVGPNDERTISPGGNWTWNRHNGTLVVLNNTDFDTSRSANVSGYYVEPNSQQDATKNIAVTTTGTSGDTWLLGGIIMITLGALGVLAKRSGGT